MILFKFCRYCLFVLMVLLGPVFSATGQEYTLTIVLDVVPEKHSKDDVFVAGNFNEWNPGAAAFKLNNTGATRSLSVQLRQRGLYEFKFTRGGWDKVMCNNNGGDVENVRVELNADTVIHYSVLAWKDDFAPVEKKHTLSKNVSIIEQGMLMPQLGRSRRIWLYLPENYKSSVKRYPVLYMHDGQNLFDEYTSAYGEWGVDEILDSIFKKYPGNECIVVGIDNAEQRLTEYNPYDNERFGKAEGGKYLMFIEQTLKPYIDKNYRTLKDPSNTMIAGSSMGGLISYYAALYHSSSFGKAGIFSPSFWVAPQIMAATDSLGARVKGKLFFYIGAQEGDEHVSNMYNVLQRLGATSSSLVYSLVDPEGTHKEASWRRWFPEFIRFMMADWTNYIIRD